MFLGTRGLGVPPFRCAAVWGGLTLASGALAALLWPPVAEAGATLHDQRLEGVAFETALTWASAAMGLAVLGWLWLVMTVVVVDAGRGSIGHRAGVPAVLRRGVLALCGVGLVSALAVPMAGATAPLTRDDRALGLDGLRLPERVAIVAGAPDQPAPGGPAPVIADPAVDPSPASRARSGGSDPVRAAGPSPESAWTVRPGDTLWEIATGRLGVGVGEDAVAVYVAALYAANRDAIGSDPDLIRPGQHLVLPAPAGPAASGARA